MIAKNKACFGLIMAAGAGSRIGGQIPKQYLSLSEETIITYSIKSLLAHPLVSDVVVVIASDHEKWFTECCSNLPILKTVIGGQSRQESVLKGLTALQQHQPDYVLIHDAARPFLSFDVIGRVLEGLKHYPAVLPVLPVFDTLKEIDSGLVKGTLDRTKFAFAQTPQGFEFSSILEAHQKGIAEQLTDDVAAMELLDLPIGTVAGEESLFKITSLSDLEKAENYMSMKCEYRTGIGFDVHSFGPGNFVTICGVPIPHNRSLIGHSDADVGMHALTDAILGAIACGDIGLHFPPSDDSWKKADSQIFLRHACDLLKQRKGKIINADLIITCEQPKISPFRTRMCQEISEIIGITYNRINVKATTTEGLGFLGRREGIAAQANVSIRLPISDEIYRI